MNVGEAPRVVVDKCLRLVRLPMDFAVGLLPGDGNGVRTMARLAVDRADATLRGVASALLGDAGPAQASDGPPDGGLAHEPGGPLDAGLAHEPGEQPDPAPAQDPHRQEKHQDAEPPSEDEIAARAYELYQRGMPGSPDEHWLAAEREMMSARD